MLGVRVNIRKATTIAAFMGGWLCLCSFLWWDGSYSREFKELTSRASVALEKRMWHDALTALGDFEEVQPQSALLEEFVPLGAVLQEAGR